MNLFQDFNSQPLSDNFHNQWARAPWTRCFAKMDIDQLKPNLVLRGALFPEPVQVITTIPLGESSHVINNTRAVSEQARTEVEAAIRQLNYVPGAVACSLRHPTTSTTGLLISNHTNPFFAELAHGIEEGCNLNG